MNSRVLFIIGCILLLVIAGGALVGYSISQVAPAATEETPVATVAWQPDVAPHDYAAKAKIDTSELGKLPLFHGGRPLPMDTFAKLALDQITERSTGTISFRMLDEPFGEQELDRLLPEDPTTVKEEDVVELVGRFQERKYKATRLVFSWIAEPDAWENVAFISAPHEELRHALGLPIKDPFGERLKYVSPGEVAHSRELLKYLEDFDNRRRQAGADFTMTPLDKLVQQLRGRYGLYRSITFDPRLPLTLAPIPLPGDRSKFLSQANQLLTHADEETLERMQIMATRAEPGSDLQVAAAQTLDSLRRAAQLHDKLLEQRNAYFKGAIETGEVDSDLNIEDAEELTVTLLNATTKLEKEFRKQKAELFASKGDETQQSLKKIFRDLRYNSNEMKRLAFEMQLSLYDNGDGVMVVPALNASALAKHRDAENKSHPWLSLPTVLYADELMKPYNSNDVDYARTAWTQLEKTFLAGKADTAQWTEQQENVLKRFRRLGESIEKQREALVNDTLPIGERDDDLIAYTKYPTASIIETEVRYLKLTPFWWSGMICFIAAAFLAGSVASIRWPMFSIALGFLAFAILWTIFGFYLRVQITGWAPVTNMFETVVFVPLVALILGAWFMITPVVWPSMRDGWRLSAIPFFTPPRGDASSIVEKFTAATAEATPLSKEQKEIMPATGWNMAGFGLMLVRVAIMGGLIWFLSFQTYADGGRPIFPLSPRAFEFQHLVTWLISMSCLVGTVWVLPRVLIQAAAAPIMLVIQMMRGQVGWKEIAQAADRKVFVMSATLLAGGLFLLASFSPVLDENFSPLTPVLRSNFWLTIHVLTIVASYGAGLLAWGLGLIALGFYAFGAYRSPVVPESSKKLMPEDVEQPKSLKRLPPREVSTLANYSYRAIQVAVLLLAAGTILGGLWADVSWGRFWGWDPKEVWALISLLIYLAVLHGRYAGWFNNFGLVFGTIAGASMITMSWYGVNFALPQLAGGSVGLHSYGEGAGGLAYVGGFVLLNWVFLGIATARYAIETNLNERPEEIEEPIAVKLASEAKA